MSLDGGENVAAQFDSVSAVVERAADSDLLAKTPQLPDGVEVTGEVHNIKDFALAKDLSLDARDFAIFKIEKDLGEGQYILNIQPKIPEGMDRFRSAAEREMYSYPSQAFIDTNNLEQTRFVLQRVIAAIDPEHLASNRALAVEL